jgi:hypothetical protein
METKKKNDLIFMPESFPLNASADPAARWLYAARKAMRLSFGFARLDLLIQDRESLP